MDQKISDSSVAAVDDGATKTKTDSTTSVEIKEKEPIKKKVVAAGGDNGQKKPRVNKKKKKVIVISAVAKDSTLVTSEGGAKECRVQVSNTKKPLFFYLNVAKRYIKQNNYVELSALGMAIPTVVTISEILKKDGWVTEKKIGTSTVTLKDEAKGRVIMKAKIEILLERQKGLVDNKAITKSNEKAVAKKNGTAIEGTLTDKKVSQNDGENVVKQVTDEIPNMQKASCGGMADKENSEVAIAAH